MIDDLHDLVGAYALDALPAEERARFERHLTECASCREEVVALTGVADLLSLAVPEVKPAASLRDRVVAAVAAEVDGRQDSVRPAVALPGPAAARRRVPSFAWVSRPVSAFALAAAVVIAGLGVWNVQLRHDLDTARSTSAFQQHVEQQLARGATVTQIPGSSAEPAALAALVQPKQGSGELIVDGLRANPNGRVFQVWLLRGAQPRSAGVFTYRQSGPEVVPLALPAGGYTGAAVTVEPGPAGSKLPTTPPVLAGKLIA